MPDGTVVVAYLDTTLDGVQEGLATIMVTLSDDGGRTFSRTRPGRRVPRDSFPPAKFFLPLVGRGVSAARPSAPTTTSTSPSPPSRATNPPTTATSTLLRSLDKGQTWEAPVRVNTDDTDRIQFFPAIDVSPDGTLHAMWGDMRDDPQEARYHIYYSESSDQGATWGFVDEQIGLNTPDTRVTDFPPIRCEGFPEDASWETTSPFQRPTRTCTSSGPTRGSASIAGPNQQVGFARKRAIAPPSLFLNPPSGDAGRDVAIQGFGFQPDSDITIDVGGITITNLLSNERGEFQTNVYMPVTGEGARNVTAYDETGNVATASFFTEFGFDSIARELEAFATILAHRAATPVAEPNRASLSTRQRRPRRRRDHPR